MSQTFLHSSSAQPCLSALGSTGWGGEEEGARNWESQHRQNASHRVPNDFPPPALGCLWGSQGCMDPEESIHLGSPCAPHQLRAACWSSWGCADPEASIHLGFPQALHPCQLQAVCWSSRGWAGPEGSVHVGSPYSLLPAPAKSQCWPEGLWSNRAEASVPSPSSSSGFPQAATGPDARHARTHSGNLELSAGRVCGDSKVLGAHAQQPIKDGLGSAMLGHPQQCPVCWEVCRRAHPASGLG